MRISSGRQSLLPARGFDRWGVTGMWNYVARRILQLVPILFGVSFLVFSALYIIPGDAVEAMLAESGASAADLERIREAYGLNDPFLVQYGRFISRAVQGDLGRSLTTKMPVTVQIAQQLNATLQLTVASLAFAVILGINMGVLAATRRGSWVDVGVMAIALLGVSMPSFWLGLVFMFVFSLKLNLLPAAGNATPVHLILPALTLGLSAAGIVARVTRSSTLEVMGLDYVRTARAKGLRERTVIWRHALRNSLISVVTIVGLQFGSLLGGAVVVETVFARQGIGTLAASSILRKDFPLVQGTVLVATLAFVVVNLIVDLSYGWLDPRIQYS